MGHVKCILSNIFWHFLVFAYSFAYSFFPNFPLSVPFGTTPNEPTNESPSISNQSIPRNLYLTQPAPGWNLSPIFKPGLCFQQELNLAIIGLDTGLQESMQWFGWFGIDTSPVTSRRVVFPRKFSQTKIYLVGGFSPTPAWKICASQNGWNHLPQRIGVKIKKYLSCHHLDIYVTLKRKQSTYPCSPKWKTICLIEK